MRTSSSFFDVLTLFFFVLVLPASIGVFAQGATATAIIIVLAITVPLTALFVVAATVSTPPPTDAQGAE